VSAESAGKVRVAELIRHYWPQAQALLRRELEELPWFLAPAVSALGGAAGMEERILRIIAGLYDSLPDDDQVIDAWLTGAACRLFAARSIGAPASLAIDLDAEATDAPYTPGLADGVA
jgi:hypothetical protein